MSARAEAGAEVAACCAAVYADPAVRWLLGGELHPGGEATTRRALELAGVAPGDRLLDVACGEGTSALLAAGEIGCTVCGVDYSTEATARGRQSADRAGLGEHVELTFGNAEALAFADGTFDAVLCECALSTFADQRRALAEMRRTLRPGGRLALADVVVERSRLPAQLDGVLAGVACIGGARSRSGYEALFAAAELRPVRFESRDGDAAALADRVRDRLRGVRLVGIDRLDGSPLTTSEAIELVDAARGAIADGALGYGILIVEG